MNFHINPTRIDTATALRVKTTDAYRQRFMPGDLDEFDRQYLAAGRPRKELVRHRRGFELNGAPAGTILWLAHHHIREAARTMEELFVDSTTMKEWPYPEPAAYCKQVPTWIDMATDRLFPAFDALERLGIDPDRQCRQAYDMVLNDFRRRLAAVDARTFNANGKTRWSARWAGYKAECSDWYGNEWLPFLQALTGYIVVPSRS